MSNNCACPANHAPWRESAPRSGRSWRGSRTSSRRGSERCGRPTQDAGLARRRPQRCGASQGIRRSAANVPVCSDAAVGPRSLAPPSEPRCRGRPLCRARRPTPPPASAQVHRRRWRRRGLARSKTAGKSLVTVWLQSARQASTTGTMTQTNLPGIGWWLCNAVAEITGGPRHRWCRASTPSGRGVAQEDVVVPEALLVIPCVRRVPHRPECYREVVRAHLARRHGGGSRPLDNARMQPTCISGALPCWPRPPMNL